MCFPEGEYRILMAAIDVDGADEAVTFRMAPSRLALWRHTHLTLDVVPGRGFSPEAPDGARLLIRSRLLDGSELAALNP